MSNIFAKLDVNPFADDVVTEPRRISFSVKGLNEKPLEQLIASFRKLMEGELPRRQIVAHKAQLVVSPDRGYGKSHLLGRLFKNLGEEATLIYLRPFQDPQRIWSSILQATVQELERPDQNGKEAGSQLEAFSKGGDSAEVVAQNVLWELRKFVGMAARTDDVTMIAARVV